MPKCEFSESQFEISLMLELRAWHGAGRFHKPSSRQEAALGYDLAISGWTPMGTVTGYCLASLASVSLPQLWVSSFLQCKRPIRVNRGRGPTSNLVSRLKARWSVGGYYRFRLPRTQFLTLRNLSWQTRGLAEVRYASPCFHKLSELWKAEAGRKVVCKTHFVDPYAIGPNHTTYAYPDPWKGCACSEEKHIETRALHKDLWSLLKEGKPLEEHVNALYRVMDCSEQDHGVAGWVAAMAEVYDMDRSKLESWVPLLKATLAVAHTAWSKYNAVWTLWSRGGDCSAPHTKDHK